MYIYTEKCLLCNTTNILCYTLWLYYNLTKNLFIHLTEIKIIIIKSFFFNFQADYFFINTFAKLFNSTGLHHVPIKLYLPDTGQRFSYPQARCKKGERAVKKTSQRGPQHEQTDQ